MTILFLCWEYLPIGSGIGRYVGEMAAALRGIGHSPVIVTSRAPELPEQETLERGAVYRFYRREDLRRPGVAEQVLDVARRTTFFIAMAPYLCRNLESKGIEPQRIYDLPNGVVVPPYRRGGRERRTECGQLRPRDALESI